MRSLLGLGHRAKFNQRCAVRVTYSTNKTPGQWRAHGYYIARESATQKEDIKAAGFNARNETVNVSEQLASWQAAGDERLFKIIVSPEFGERMDLVKHTRDLMKYIEKSLGGELQWVAVAHYNTGHPHVHIALRGIDERGMSLRLPREFIQTGIRHHAEDLATKQLGYRTELDALEAQRGEVSQLRFTSLDRVLQRMVIRKNGDWAIWKAMLDIRMNHFTRAQQHYVLARLGKLVQLGLAEKTGRRSWRVRKDFEAVLRTLQQTGDHQKMLARHRALLSDERLPLEVTPSSRISFLEGRVLGHGLEEGTEQPYLLLEGTDEKVHFVSQTEEMQSARRAQRLGVNSFVRLEKHFVDGQPTLRCEDLGNAEHLLKDDTYFRTTALRLVRAGVLQIDVSWGGWLGAYQKQLQEQLTRFRHHRQARSRKRDRAR